MAEPTILDRIVAQRREDVRAAREEAPFVELQAKLRQAPPAIDFAARLREAAPDIALLAEIKRASPSKGDIAPGMNAARQGMKYARAGAAAISVLTEPTWFKGTLDDMLAVRTAVGQVENRPAVLRKDFVVDPYQVMEARAYGADAVLLIVACLDEANLQGLLGLVREMGMEALVEVNNAEEMQRAVGVGATVIGINNRDLRSFDVDLGTTDRLAGMVPEGTLLAALSGVHQREDVERFARAGASAVLVGEALMVADDPAAKIRELVGATG